MQFFLGSVGVASTEVVTLGIDNSVPVNLESTVRKYEGTSYVPYSSVIDKHR